MPYGIKIASTIFQRAFEQVFGEDIKDMVCYQDDICIGATNENELKKKIDIILNRLRNAGMSINENKCMNNCSKISFLGYSISKEDTSLDLILIEKIRKIATSTSKKELETFLGIGEFLQVIGTKNILTWLNHLQI